MGYGVAAQAARANGWGAPVSAKTGTTEAHESAAFMGFNDKFAAATYIFNDGTSSSPICSSPPASAVGVIFTVAMSWPGPGSRLRMRWVPSRGVAVAKFGV